MPGPRITVVTAVRDAAGTIGACLESVRRQGYADVEHVVVDGASTDGTVAVLRAHERPGLRWVSEPDGGIYDALNKGVSAARGEWIHFLGADDVLAAPDVLERVAPLLRSGAALVYGDVRYRTGQPFRSSVGPMLLVGNTVHHQGAFYAARSFHGWRYDASLRVAADYELNLRLYRAGERCVRADVVVAECADEGASRVRIRESFREMNLVRRRQLGAAPSAALAPLLAGQFAAHLLLRRLRRGPGR